VNIGSLSAIYSLTHSLSSKAITYSLSIQRWTAELRDLVRAGGCESGWELIRAGAFWSGSGSAWLELAPGTLRVVVVTGTENSSPQNLRSVWSVTLYLAL
jgi:hypothetical protein